MRYLMRQKIFSFGDDFTIQDETGRDVYFVDGKALSIGDQLSFQDLQGNGLAWSDTYGIDVNDDEDPVLVLASAVIVDLACHSHEKR